jgi:hypothetical protein
MWKMDSRSRVTERCRFRECMGNLLSLFGSSKDESVEFSEANNTYFFQIDYIESLVAVDSEFSS